MKTVSWSLFTHPVKEGRWSNGQIGSVLLLRSGHTVVTVDTRAGPIPAEQIDRLLSLLSSDQEV